ncbi:MAG: cobaltochelatase subunit CobN [Chromatiales bacterium]|nr:cobaltochelatase subunit CobN [Chromatiales bacterium]
MIRDLRVRAALAALMVALVSLSMPVVADTPPRVVILATDFVLEAKLRAVQDAAIEQGVVLGYFIPGQAENAEVSRALAEADLVIMDAPRLNDGPVLMQAFDEALAAHRGKRLSIIGGIAAGLGGLGRAEARALGVYYVNGTRANYSAFFRYFLVNVLGTAVGAVPEPLEFPAAGIYHPDLPELVTADPISYADWLSRRDLPAERGTVGIIMSQGLFPSDQLELFDAVIRKVEAAGARPWAFYFEGHPQARMTHLTMLEDLPAVDVLVNLTHLRGTDQRISDLVDLDVALIQGFVYRDGGREAWRANASGIPMYAVPAFLTVPEQMGAHDTVVIAAEERGEAVLLEEQASYLVSRAVRMARLRWAPVDTRELGLMFWSYPPGERGVSASHLNVPRSLANLLEALSVAGYQVEQRSAEELEIALPALLDPWQGRVGIADWISQNDSWVGLPLSRYQAWYENLPEDVRSRVESAWGPPEADPLLVPGDTGEPLLVLPALELGSLIIMPQPARVTGDVSLASYHDGELPPSHAYLGAYFYLREVHAIDALVHFGTHGTQEFLSGKDRGLSIYDDALLVLGDMPVIYPYITDNAAEALQARRRGQAVTVSHQPPPFVPAGLHGEIQLVHDLMHEWEMLDTGPVRADVEQTLMAMVLDGTIYRDLQWDAARLEADFPAFLEELHIYMHELARDTQPLGLHTLGVAPDRQHRVATVMQMLGDPLYEALGVDDIDELFAVDYELISETLPFLFLSRFLVDGSRPRDETDPRLREFAEQAVRLDAALQASGEIDAILAALKGRYVPGTSGGDPLRNPDVLPTGRNIFGFDPSRVPSERAWRIGQTLADELISLHLQSHDGFPRSLAMSLWSSDTMRQQGVLEAQMLWLLGLQPVWDRAGRLARLDIIPAEALGRPRVDVVASVTGVYRDQFGHFIGHLSSALQELAALDEPANPVAEHSRALAARLSGNGLDPSQALAVSALRVFSNEAGSYGSGVPDALLDTEGWASEDELVADYLGRMQYAYGAGSDKWGVRTSAVNLYAEHLQHVEGAVLSRSSNLHGLLSTDHPFEYLGSIAMAVRSLTGRNPALYISNLRNPTGGQNTTAGRYLSGELRSRYHHPGWISGMQNEGYAGTLELLNVVNNFFGWQVTDPDTVRADQWASFHDVYVRDSLDLGLEAWFAEHNAGALARILDRMLEAVRRDYWAPDEEVLRDLVERRQALIDTEPLEARLEEFASALANGFGLDAAFGQAQTVIGQQLRPVSPPSQPVALDTTWLVVAGLFLLMGAGALRQMVRS